MHQLYKMAKLRIKIKGTSAIAETKSVQKYHIVIYYS